MYNRNSNRINVNMIQSAMIKGANAIGMDFNSFMEQYSLIEKHKPNLLVKYNNVFNSVVSHKLKVKTNRRVRNRMARKSRKINRNN